ncbi:MAG: hypothetical protein M1831_002249 [Alyxoria varia]|nr:MAG: hypothetical protein M1831_002249 [Alyxoria varia]
MSAPNTRPPSRGRTQQPPPPQPNRAFHSRTPSYPIRESSLSSGESSLSSSQANNFTMPTPKPPYAMPAAASSTSSLASSSAAAASSGMNNRPQQAQPRQPTQPATAHERQLQHQAQQQQALSSHRPRQHSQGFFEPSLPSHANAQPAQSRLTESQIAAQAAMHQTPRNDRGGSQDKTQQQQQPMGGPSRGGAGGGIMASQTQQNPKTNFSRPGNPPPLQTAHLAGTGSSSGSSGGNYTPTQSRNITSPPGGYSNNKNTGTAASAAVAAFPRSPLGSPQHPPSEYTPSPTLERGDPMDRAVPARIKEKDKEKPSKRKLWGKPSKIHISKDKDVDKKAAQTAGIYGGFSHNPSFNQSTSSLADMAPPPSIYGNAHANSSTSTLVPSEREKTRHHFLSRQKNKFKDDHPLQLSSASSSSRPTDPRMPQALYSFAPSSPGVSNKSISGLDLRHGGRALREKKKEEKAAAASNFVPPLPSGPTTSFDIQRDHHNYHPGNLESNPAPLAQPTVGTPQGGAYAEMGIPSQGLTGFGLQGMNADDAWPLLKAKLLNIFEGEDLRTPIEDFNRLVSAHMQRCIQRRAPRLIVEDFRELLKTGFTSLDHTLRGVPDEKVVPHLVEMWAFVFGTVLPFMQAVFLPLDLEFKGRGVILKESDAADFWRSASQLPANDKNKNTNMTLNLDVRTFVLAAFRDVVILPRHDALLTIFSRLSLDSISTALSATTPPPYDPTNLPPFAPGQAQAQQRPGTAASAGAGAPNDNTSSYNSQTSTLLDSSLADSSLGARSRATSNTSAGSFGSASSATTRFPPRAAGAGGSLSGPSGPSGAVPAVPVMDSAKVTQIAARMLQCVSVLAGIQMKCVTPSGSRARGASNPSGNAEHVGGGGTATSRAAETTGPIGLAMTTSPTSSSYPNPNSTQNPINSPQTTRDTDRDRTGDRDSTSSDTTESTNSTATTTVGPSSASTAADDAETAARRKMERLGKELKLNWLGRGRTGRNRRGLVGTKMPAGGVGGGGSAGLQGMMGAGQAGRVGVGVGA